MDEEGVSDHDRPPQFLLFTFSTILYLTPRFFWDYKGKGGTPEYGTELSHAHTHAHTLTEPETWEPVPSLAHL